MNITDEFIDLTIYTDNEIDDINIIIKYLFLSIPSNVLLICLISLIIWTILKPLSTKN